MYCSVKPQPAPLSADALRFVQEVLGKPITSDSATSSVSESVTPQQRWLADISTKHERELNYAISRQAEARKKRSHDEWLIEYSRFQEAEWDPAKHPRRGSDPNPGWFATTPGGGAGGKVAFKRKSYGGFDDAIIKRNKLVGDLTGNWNPDLAQSSKSAIDLVTTLTLPADVGIASIDGLGTGGKAVINGTVTAVKNVATLGLDNRQLELIGVTKADRDRGYDTAVTIATASGDLLVAALTSGAATALSKGGKVGRVTSGALVVFDAAGNAVGVVQGVYDAASNRLNLRNGTQIVASTLGLGANATAIKSFGSTKPPKAPDTQRRSSKSVVQQWFPDVDEFVSKLPRKNTPTSTPANQYEIKHAGPYNYTVSGGGVSFDIDGYRGATILEAKHVGKPAISPYIPSSSCSDVARKIILDKMNAELQKARTIIESGATPFKSIEIITNSREAKSLFEEMLRQHSLPGSVRFEP
jgi:hypothetical protein